jgi:hypothetical protein
MLLPFAIHRPERSKSMRAKRPLRRDPDEQRFLSLSSIRETRATGREQFLD